MSRVIAVCIMDDVNNNSSDKEHFLRVGILEPQHFRGEFLSLAIWKGMGRFGMSGKTYIWP